MAAPNGNSNALIWTPDKVKTMISEIEEMIDADIDRDIIYLGQILSKCRISRKQWHRIKMMYAPDEILIERMDVIEDELSTRLTMAGLHGKVKSNVAQFVLKAQCGYGEEAKEKKKTEAYAEAEEAVDAAAIAAIEKEVGPLSAKFAYSKGSREILRMVAGKTKNGMRDMGYFYENGGIIGPRPYIIVSDDFSFAL